MSSLRIIDLFAGVGGLSQGFISNGFEVEFAIEYDKEIAESYRLNHPNTDVYAEDIAKIDFNVLKEKHGSVDVIVGGPPCQGFSQKGKRLSIKDERNYLFQKFIEAVDIFKPNYFVLENVPNILTTANGFFKNEIGRTPNFVFIGSSFNHSDIESFKNQFLDLILKENPINEALISNNRHFECLSLAFDLVSEALNELKRGQGAEFLSIPLREALLKVQEDWCNGSMTALS